MSENNKILINKMKNGDADTIEQCLTSQNSLLNMNATLQAMVYGIKSNAVENGLKKLKESEEEMLHVRLADVACAALDVLNFEKYHGTRDEVIKIIKDFTKANV